ncbi:TetR/AcrR family transcriptional regulator [Sanguibacter suaedae]|uniref:TetR/AcrR family transcriptional regulator n=1 Tax=Sanguibacter suaedae TaxID=2795737 RepID=A0A934IDI5_9MICO|nr:TetR/AcrR family transcriptional regulator [Sanguibacter suaedae]MBI9115851.1 TetR/AcrR family transcriptional regulator [Sanguibacter suaedae]
MQTAPDPAVPEVPEVPEVPGVAVPGSRAGRGNAKGRATRDQILEAAMRLFGEMGYHSASLREIAARVGISHPGLLHHFPTKEALLAAVLQRRDEVDDVALQADLDAGVDFFDALVDVVRRNAARPGIVELYATLSAEASSPEHPAHAYFRARYRKTLRVLEEQLEHRRVAGSLRRDVRPRTVARAVTALMDGLQVQWLLERGEDDQVDMAAVLEEALGLVLMPPSATGDGPPES